MTDITILPFDLTGTLASNLRVSEEHTLTLVTGRTNRMFAPKFGAYYKESLEVRTSAGVKLNYDTDYVCTYYYADIWDLNAKECCAIIVVTNPLVGNDIKITYQAVGGPYALSLDELKDILTEVDNSPESIAWDDIRNKPLQFPPALHYHEYWQLYGLESTVENLELLGEAWAVGRKGVLDDNRYYYEGYIDLAQKALDDYRVKVMAHITDRSNPHLTDKNKVGLGLINNWGMADATESATITVNNKYQPIGGVYDQLTNHVFPVLDLHVRDTNNPHRVQLTDPLLNLYSTAQIQQLINLRLARTETAFDSAAFQAIPLAQLYANFRTGLPAESVLANSVLPQALIAPAVPGWNPDDYVLNGANQFLPYSVLMQAYNDTQGSVYYIGATPLASWAHLSTGTYVITGTYVSFNSWRTMPQLSVYLKTGPGNSWAQAA
ncbi:virion structural protein [Pseudomonas phage 201phi2-1]|uniref:Virion structural protein n=1 Tax=Pseudomonas phage 201phi2-1 TaxID=198110 RepID=B3FJ82_BP201|nr:virion structural protein [Pseudomonas phage 201phi2-1]ABY63049.1 virion structural protein [Pseudomonas phage 201phi2-1]